MANLKNYMSGSASQFVKAVDFELSRGINHVNTLASECGFDDEIVLYKPKSKHLDNQSVIQIKVPLETAAFLVTNQCRAIRKKLLL